MEKIISFITLYPWVGLLIALWVVTWKGMALWKAAQRNEKWWFIVLLVANTLGLLEIIYIFYFSKKPLKISENKLS